MRFRIKSLLIGAVLSALLISTIHFLRNPLNKAFLDKDYWRNLVKLESTLRIINGYYLHQEDINYETLADSAIRGMTYRLDRYSEYVSPEEYEAFSMENLGEYHGLGIMLSMKNGEVQIQQVLPNSPADKAGLKESDQITHINNVRVQDLGKSNMLSMLHSTKYEKIEMNIHREMEDADTHSFAVSIQKRLVSVESIEAKKLEGVDVGYIRIVQFTENSVHDFKQSISEFMQEGTQKLVLDLRDNPGGLLDVAIRIADLFHKKDEVMLMIKSWDKSSDTSITASSEFIGNLVQLAILVNSNTCSSAELLAGALHQRLNAPLVGETTYGKGSIQNIFSLDQKTALKLTSANYLLADGSDIDEVGLEPNYPIELSDNSAQSILGSMVGNSDNESDEHHDQALKKAVELLIKE